MNIKGVQKSSFIDYPDRIASVVFTGGCNFKCPYCHNRDLAYNLGETLDQDDVIETVLSRAKYIDGVCITGGEATLQKGLIPFMERLKKNGLLVKLDTNGTFPDLIRELLDRELVDYIAMDVKAPLSKYRALAGVKVNTDDIERSMGIIRNSDIDYEFRTTICKELLSLNDIIAIGRMVKGCKRYTLQNFRDSGNILSGEVYTPYKKEELAMLPSELEDYFEKFHIRY